MVLEEITKEVNDAESNQENQKNSLSTVQGITPNQRSTRQGTKSQTDDGTVASLASTLPLRRRARSSLELIRRLSTELTKQKRRRESLSAIDADTTNKRTASQSRRKGGILDLLQAVHEREREFAEGFGMEVCSVGDVRLIDMHERFQAEEQCIGSLDALMHANCDNLKGALFKFLDTVVGYMLYAQKPACVGVTSGSPLDSLIVLWVAPEYQRRGHEKNMLHWWLRNSVRSVKFFAANHVPPSVKVLLQDEGFKCPKSTYGGDTQVYVATI